MRWLLPMLACGCNAVFNLDTTQPFDAPPPVDAPPPPRCPDVGTTVPRFGQDLFAIPAYSCDSYTLSSATDRAAGYCNNTIALGKADDVLTPTLAGMFIYNPRLSPEGDRVFATHYNENTGYYEIAEYTADDAMTLVGSYNPGTAGGFPASTPPSRGPDRRMLFIDNSMYPATLVELSDLDGHWKPIDKYVTTDFGDITGFDSPSLSPDGTRLLFIASQPYVVQGGNGSGSDGGPPMQQFQSPIMYAERATVQDRFGKAQILDTVPDLVRWPFMTEDCGRIYFSALNRVFYLKQAIN